jgi:aminopeptidase-like protein
MNDGQRMKELLERLWPLRRSLVSDGYDEALRIIAEDHPLQTLAFPSGTPCWTWTLPEKWTCHEAYVETLDGRRVIDYADHALHVVDYSLPIDREVSRQELLDHLFVHPKNPDAVPYVFKFYERDWGFCCSQKTRDALSEERYRVVIRSVSEPGTLKVGQSTVEGRTDRLFIIEAHLCHPMLANDDLSGVVVALELMRRLRTMPDLNYTYMLLLVPETIGTIAWLSHHEDLVPRMQGGLFLEMLGRPAPHALQRSYSGDTQPDRALEYVLARHDPRGYVRDYGEIIRNDEIEFNAPSFRVPMLSLSRVLPPESPDWPYPEYHTHFDSPAIIDAGALGESLDLAFEMVMTNDHNVFARGRFKGQVFCSRYGLYPKDPIDQVAMFRMMAELDGGNSLIDICRKHRLEFGRVRGIIRSLMAHDLVDVGLQPLP